MIAKRFFRANTSLNKTRTSEVGATSKAQKAQNMFLGIKLEFFKNFFRKMSHSAKKSERGHFGFFNFHFVARYQKIQRGTLWRY